MYKTHDMLGTRRKTEEHFLSEINVLLCSLEGIRSVSYRSMSYTDSEKSLLGKGPVIIYHLGGGRRIFSGGSLGFTFNERGKH